MNYQSIPWHVGGSHKSEVSSELSTRTIEAYPIFDVPYVPDEKSNEQKAYEISKHFLRAHLCTSSFLEGIKIGKFAFDL